MSCLGKIDERAAVPVRLPIIGQTVGNLIAGQEQQQELPAKVVNADGSITYNGPDAIPHNLFAGPGAFGPDDSTTVDEIIVTAPRQDWLHRYIINPIENFFDSSGGGVDGTYSNYFYYEPPSASEVRQLRQQQAQFAAQVANIDPVERYIARPVGQFLDAHPRIAGGLQATGGVFEMVGGGSAVAGGAATSEFGVGVPVAIGGGVLAVHGADDFQAGLRTVFGGTPTSTFTNLGLQATGLSPQAASMVEFLGTAGAGGLASSGRLLTAGTTFGRTAPLDLGPTQIGSFTPPANLKFGTTLFGDYAHLQAADVLQDLHPDVPLEFRVLPGQRGVDVTVPDEFVGDVGFKYGEIKPLTASGEATMARQVQKWGLAPNSVRPITYDAQGNIYYGFR